jgi:hypothetical protein
MRGRSLGIRGRDALASPEAHPSESQSGLRATASHHRGSCGLGSCTLYQPPRQTLFPHPTPVLYPSTRTTFPTSREPGVPFCRSCRRGTSGGPPPPLRAGSVPWPPQEALPQLGGAPACPGKPNKKRPACKATLTCPPRFPGKYALARRLRRLCAVSCLPFISPNSDRSSQHAVPSAPILSFSRPICSFKAPQLGPSP